jgi:hypothetical protein
MIVSFTGTSRGTTAEQKSALGRLLVQLRPAEVHHGNCVGADTECAEIAAALVPRPKIIAHPGTSANHDDHELLGRCPHNDEVLAAKTHFARNRALVDLLVGNEDLLIVAPFDPTPVTLGGTAYTVTYCGKRAKKFVVIWPAGHITEDWTLPAN